LLLPPQWAGDNP